jgi:hypothetical protein
VQVFFATGVMPNEVDDTAIVMISKKKDPEELRILDLSVYVI